VLLLLLLLLLLSSMLALTGHCCHRLAAFPALGLFVPNSEKTRLSSLMLPLVLAKIPVYGCDTLQFPPSRTAVSGAGVGVALQSETPHAAASIINAHPHPPNVPTKFPSTARRAPTGARAGSKAEATIGAEATPPMFACAPTAMKNSGALMKKAMEKTIAKMTIIQNRPRRKMPVQEEEGACVQKVSDWWQE
jgi:hypothetical protein